MFDYEYIPASGFISAHIKFKHGEHHVLCKKTGFMIYHNGANVHNVVYHESTTLLNSLKKAKRHFCNLKKLQA